MKFSFSGVTLFLGAALAVVLSGCAAEPRITPPQITQAPSASPAPDDSENVPEPAASPRYVLGTLSASNSLAIIDPLIREGSAIIGSIVVGTAPWGVATHVEKPGSGEGSTAAVTAYVATAEGLAVVDLNSQTRTSLVPFQNQPTSISYGEYRRGGLGLAVSPSGDRVYVAVNRGNGPAALEVFDTATSAFVASVDVGLRPFDVLMSADGSQVYTIDHDSFTVTTVDTATLTPRSVEVAPFGTVGGLGSWEKPHYGVVYDGKIVLPYQGQELAILDPSTGTYTTQPMTANTHQHGVALTSDNQLLVVGTGEFGSATAGPSLTIRSMADGRERLIPLDRLHETVTPWQNPETDSSYAVLGGGYTRDGAWDGATVVDLTTSTQYEIAVPGRPQAVVPLPPEVVLAGQ